ncbi:MAG: tetratricopeptide repeat protein [Burkholderiales bacterium]|nr:MAG: tetratricopeptide repeat protein [Burkholderiales bacterium]
MSKRAIHAIGSASAALVLAGCATPFQHSDPSSATEPQQSLSHGAGDSAGQYALGKYYLGQGRQALALIAFTKAVEFDPDNADARNGRATVLSQFGEHGQAIAELRAAVAIKPDAAYLHNNLGYVEYLRGNYMAAAESLRTAFRLDPLNQGVRANWTLLAARASSDAALAAVLERDPSATRGSGLSASPPPVATTEALRAVQVQMSRDVVSIGRIDLAKPAEAGAPQRARPDHASAPRLTATMPSGYAPRRAAPAHGDQVALSGSVINLDAAAMRVRAREMVRSAETKVPETVRPVADPLAPVAIGMVRLHSVSVAPVARVTPGLATPVAPVTPVTRVTRVARAAPAPSTPPPTPVVARAPGATVIPAAPPQHRVTASRTVNLASPADRVAVRPAPAAVTRTRPAMATALRHTRIEVLNGNGTRHMARGVGNELGARGLNVVRIGNAETFSIPSTRIYFREGFMREALALARQFKRRPAVMISAVDDLNADILLVLGRDQGSEVAFADRPHAKVAVAQPADKL